MDKKAVTKVLVIQTAFIGDVILATALIEKLHEYYPGAKIDFLLRKGNENLLVGHPFLGKVHIFDKTKGKYKNLLKLIKEIRKEKYSHVVNAQRFMTTGLITLFSGGRYTIGFDKNPLSMFFGQRAKHVISTEDNQTHETDRNQALIANITDAKPALPKLYPSEANYQKVLPYQAKPYVCMAPTSVWFTKQYPASKWVELINMLDDEVTVYLLGAPSDQEACESIAEATKHKQVQVMTGKLNLLDSAALMQKAIMNFVNDSAPMHLCSAVNAPTCAIFCSTVPRFGFGPLSSMSYVVEADEKLSCRPCGLHGHKACPEQHFNCAQGIDNGKIHAIYLKAKAVG